MANLTSVGITSGVPTSGTGTVSTIDNLLAVGTPISDGTTNLVAVKAASTAAVAGDKALVVALSPNNINPNGQTTMSASAPVVIASNQSALPVTMTSTTLTGTSIVNLVPVTSGGLTISSTLIASGTNATSVKASAGQLYKIEVTNNSANIGYLKIYNTASAPTAGAGTPVIRLMCPASASGAGAFSAFDNGVAFATGIGFTFTGGIADADTTSVAASAFIVNLYYK